MCVWRQSTTIRRGFGKKPHKDSTITKSNRQDAYGVLLHDGLVAAHARVVVDIARLRHADNGVNQEIAACLCRSQASQLNVRTMHRIASLERAHCGPPLRNKFGTQLLRRKTQRCVVVVHRQLNTTHRAAQIVRASLVKEVRNSGVGLIVGAAKHLLSLELLVGHPRGLYLQHCQSVVLSINQSDRAADGVLGGRVGGDIQCDRHRPQSAIRQSALRNDAAQKNGINAREYDRQQITET